jgi:CheY-like chemotaxis protein
VADDNEDIRQLWRTCLTQCGFEVREAADGMDAVAQAVGGSPDFIVMDFCMPRLNGADAVRAIRRHVGAGTPPVVGLTAHPTADFREVCDTILEKPVSPTDLLDALRCALRDPSSSGRRRPPPD